MKICIFGAGAVGGHIAANLAAQGHDVSVVARGAHLQAIRANGLKLLHGGKPFSAACGRPSTRGSSVRRTPCS